MSKRFESVSAQSSDWQRRAHAAGRCIQCNQPHDHQSQRGTGRTKRCERCTRQVWEKRLDQREMQAARDGDLVRWQSIRQSRTALGRQG